jgi:hypothetical protein
VPEIDRGLWELIELAGVVDVVRACPATASGRDRRAVPETYDA